MSDNSKPSKLQDFIKQRYGSMGQITGNTSKEWHFLCGQLEEHIAKVTAERDALLAAQMTEEKAREVLMHRIQTNNTLSLKVGSSVVLEWPAMNYRDCATMDGIFTALQLRAIAWWMENKGEAR